MIPAESGSLTLFNDNGRSTFSFTLDPTAFSDPTVLNLMSDSIDLPQPPPPPPPPPPLFASTINFSLTGESLFDTPNALLPVIDGAAVPPGIGRLVLRNSDGTELDAIFEGTGQTFTVTADPVQVVPLPAGVYLLLGGMLTFGALAKSPRQGRRRIASCAL